MKRVVVVMVLLAGSLTGFASPVSASAGYYPINKGELLEATTCVPRTMKPPVILQISGVNTNQKKVEITRATKWSKTTTSLCGTNKYEVTLKWKVNRTGEYALSAYSPNSPVDLYVWPDGIDIPDMKSVPPKSASKNLLARLNNAGTAKWFDALRPISVLDYDKRAYGSFLSRDGCLVAELIYKGSLDEIWNDWPTPIIMWEFKDYKSGRFIHLHVPDKPNALNSSCMKSASDTFNLNFTND